VPAGSTAVGVPRLAVVTGATSGLGREIARRLAGVGYRVVVVGRGEERAARVAAELAERTGPGAVDSVGVTDLARPSDVRALAAKLLARYPAIHLLVNNAGAVFFRRQVTEEGLERTFALNVLAPYLLTTLLADRLKASAPSRVVNVSSAAHYRQAVDFSDLQSERHYRGFRVYSESKLELLLLTREFARRFAGTDVTVNAVHPGFVATGFGQNNGGGSGFAIRVLSAVFGKSVKRGAETPVLVATDPSLARVTGEYFSNGHRSRGDPMSWDMAAAARLAVACAEMPGSAPLPRMSRENG